MKEQRKIWFKTKLYGWGWYPSSWQGFLIIILWVFLFANILSSNIVRLSYGEIDFFSLVFQPLILVVLLILICYGLGEKPRWRWGK